MTTLSYPQGKSYGPIWTCIYCGDDKTPEALTKEHIIPKGLNGTITLLKSSCTKCNEVTRDIETFCLDKMFIDTRTHLGLKSSKEKRPPLKIWFDDQDGTARWEEVERSDHPLAFFTFNFSRAGILTGREPNLDPNIEGQIVATPFFAERFAKLNPGASLHFTGDTDLLARMLAKMAHAFSVATHGYKGKKHLLPDLILGKSNDLFHYLGGTMETRKIDSETLHSISAKKIDDYVIVYITLFAYLSGPTYEIVAARYV